MNHLFACKKLSIIKIDYNTIIIKVKLKYIATVSASRLTIRDLFAKSFWKVLYIIVFALR